MRILFSNAGKRTYLIEYALKIKIKRKLIDIFITDTNRETAAFQVSTKTKNFITPYVSKYPKKYINELFKICKKNKIHIVIPLMDYEIPLLSKNKKKFDSINTKLLVPDINIVMNCFNKKKNYFFCLKNNITAPKTFFHKASDLKYPIIQKNIFGSAGTDQIIINNKSDLKNFNGSKHLLQKEIKGVEFGMDILNDFKGKYVHSFVRKKLSMKNGETDKAISSNSKKFSKIAKRISKIFKHIGVMDVDFIKTKNDKIYFIDFNLRFGGGYPITHLSGFNYLKAIILISLDKKINFKKNFKVHTFSKGITVYKNKYK